MADTGEGKGAVYQYYWIKVSTEEQMAKFRQCVLDGGLATLSGMHPEYIKPPLKRYAAFQGSDLGAQGRTPAQLTLGFVLSPAYAHAKGMYLERHAMPPGTRLEDAQKWIEDPDSGKKWAGDAFCVLAYVGAAEE